jgi:hypothetical protein
MRLNPGSKLSRTYSDAASQTKDSDGLKTLQPSGGQLEIVNHELEIHLVPLVCDQLIEWRAGIRYH